MGGSASIHCPEKSIYGHDGLMGSHVPISVGACYANNRPTIVFVGDAAIEEDYALGALGWASTKNLPILFIVEDNNLSILTKKSVRRNWSIHDVASAFKLEGYDIPDDPDGICPLVSRWIATKKPTLLNINTHRLYWHSGAGCDDPDIFDRYKQQMDFIGAKAQDIDISMKLHVEELWQKQLQQ
jgi:TPP-dependent pyruvate/acetoin dehydrogenase alpha subunit